jgi:hypothetical protein
MKCQQNIVSCQIYFDIKQAKYKKIFNVSLVREIRRPINPVSLEHSQVMKTQIQTSSLGRDVEPPEGGRQSSAFGRDVAKLRSSALRAVMSQSDNHRRLRRDRRSARSLLRTALRSNAVRNRRRKACCKATCFATSRPKGLMIVERPRRGAFDITTLRVDDCFTPRRGVKHHDPSGR